MNIVKLLVELRKLTKIEEVKTSYLDKLVAAVFLVNCCLADSHYFNRLRVPENQEDLLAIQTALIKQVEKARKSTVSIRREDGFGSGVIISEDGLILSAAHVTITPATELDVIFESGRVLRAKTLGLNSENDAAMLKIMSDEKFDFSPIISKEESIEKNRKLGEWCFSLGHSSGYDKARGSVLRIARLVGVDENAIFTDGPLIGGDSGGPLFDMKGKVIGIHSRVAQEINMNIHVPLYVYHEDWKQLKKGEFVGAGDYAARPGKELGLLAALTEKGIEIQEVTKDSAGAQSGLLKGDRIVKINNVTTVKHQNPSKLFVPGKDNKLLFTVIRGGKELQLNLSDKKGSKK